MIAHSNLVQESELVKSQYGDARSCSPATVHVPMLDVLRACAALMVFSYHCFTEFMAGSTSRIAPTLSHGDLGVHLFFALSGYLIYAALDKSFGDSSHNLSSVQKVAIFWAKRFFRIYPLYLVSLAAVVVLSPSVRQYLSLGDLASHIFGVHSFFRGYHGSINGVLWSLAIEIQFYIAAPFIFLAVRRVSNTQLIAVSLATWLVAYGVFRYLLIERYGMWTANGAPDSWAYFMGLNQLPSTLILFSIGFLSYRLRGVSIPPGVVVGAIVAFVALPYLLPTSQQIGIDPYLYVYIHSFLFSCLFIPLLIAASHNSRRSSLVVRLFSWVSDLSYSFYIWHLLIMRCLVSQCPGRSLGFYVCVSLAATLIASDFTARYIEKPGVAVGGWLVEKMKGYRGIR